MIQWITHQTPQEYPSCVAKMEETVQGILDGQSDEQIWLLEHPSIYTAGRSAKSSDLLNAQFPVYEAGRGGQYTYHGPGMLISYLLLDLKKRFAPDAPDIRRFVWLLEQSIIDTLAVFGIEGERREGRVGIWVSLPDQREAKIAALGIRVRKWVSYHGIAININPDLSHFAGIVPCGIKEHGVTSLHALGVKVKKEDVSAAFKDGVTRHLNV